MKPKKLILAIVLSCFIFARLDSQTECKESLYEANKLYESGNIKECITLLEPCAKIKSAHKRKYKEELIESYHLLAMAYQNLNDLKMAQRYIKKMLLMKPNYQQFPNIDPIDFSRLVDLYKITPGFYLGLKAGVNFNWVALKKSYAAYNTSQSYNSTIGYQFGLTGDYRLKPAVSLNADLLFCGLGINHLLDSTGGWKQNFNEQESYVMFNLSAQYHLKIGKKLQLNAGIGIGFGYMYASNVFFESTNLETFAVQQSTQNPIAMRNKFQTYALGIFGISYPVTNGILSLEASYSFFFSNTVNPSKRYDDLNFIFNNQYVNDDVSLRLTMLNLSYKLPLKWSVSKK